MSRIRQHFNVNTVLLGLVIGLLRWEGERIVARQDIDHDRIGSLDGGLSTLESRVSGHETRITIMEALVPTLMPRSEYWRSQRLTMSNEFPHAAATMRP